MRVKNYDGYTFVNGEKIKVVAQFPGEELEFKVVSLETGRPGFLKADEIEEENHID